MYIHITPEGVEGTNHKVIDLVVENRMDMLLLFLRVIRYLYQNNIAGEQYTWDNDMEKTRIYIENNSPELLAQTNMRPAIFLDVGETMFQHRALMDDKASMDMRGGSTKFSEHNVQFYITIIGRNKMEAGFLAERTGAALYILTENIKEHTRNINTIDGIRVGRIVPLPNGVGSPGGDTSLAFSCQLSFSVNYYLQHMIMDQVGDLFSTATFKVTSTHATDSSSTDSFVVVSEQISSIIRKGYNDPDKD